MDEFEALLVASRGAVERYVKFRISNLFDAEDVLQETYIAASRGFDALQDKTMFKAWLIGIAKNKCLDYYRTKSARREIPVAALPERSVRFGIRAEEPVRETLLRLSEKDREILSLCYYEELSEAETAARLSLPKGTVKSRLFAAKKRFKALYPYPPTQPKGEANMKTLPKILPDYIITPMGKAPFPVVWEEIMGWFIVPRLGEKCTWGMYDRPDGHLTEWDEMSVTGKAVIHGIEGVSIEVKTHDPMDCNSEGGQSEVNRTFVAELTPTHCRYLAENHTRGDVRYHYTFLDGDEFLSNWGFGEDNRGKEIHIAPKGDIIRNGSTVTHKEKSFLLDIVGRYEVTINGKTFDTVCVMDIDTYVEGMATEQYLDKNGRTVLWRRFNRNNWETTHYGKTWCEMLPESERLTVNGETFVHWYDCITDYIL